MTDVVIRCPQCHAPLAPTPRSECCAGCGSAWPFVGAIRDLRVGDDPFLSRAEDHAAATRLADASRADLSFEALLRAYYEPNARVPASQADAIIRGTLAAPQRARAFVQQVESLAQAPLGDGARVLDVGAGTAPLAVEVARRGATAWAVDVGLRWLVLAERRARQSDVAVPLLGATADALPFADHSFDAVCATSVLEWLPDQRRALSEMVRVLRPGGLLALSTPNAWFPGPDPHLGVPFGSWLSPRGVAWVARRRGILPPPRRLVSAAALRALLTGFGVTDVRIEGLNVSAEMAAAASAPARAALGTYRLVSTLPGVRQAARVAGPLLVAVGRAGVQTPARIR